MGKHSRAHKAEMERLERLRTRKRNFNIGFAVAAGSLAAGTLAMILQDNESDSTTVQAEANTTSPNYDGIPQIVLDGIAKYTDTFGCADRDDITVQMVPYINGPDPYSQALGKTADNNIAIVSDLDEADLYQVAIHEAGHACATPLTMFGRGYEHPFFDGGTIVGAEGFKAYYHDATWSTEVEEGVVEWLSSQIEGYGGAYDAGYAGAAGLTDYISRLRNATPALIADLHHQSDLVGFVALAKNKDPETVNASDFADVLSLYQEVFYSEVMPPQEDLELILNYNTDYTG